MIIAVGHPGEGLGIGISTSGIAARKVNMKRYSRKHENRSTNSGLTRDQRFEQARDAAPPFATNPAGVIPHSEFAGDAKRNGRALSPAKRAAQRAK